MKRISIMFCTACVLTMSACQQPLPPEVAAAVAEAEKTHGHVCNDDMLSCELGLCPVGRARLAAFEALEAKQLNSSGEETTEGTKAEQRPETVEKETESPITPSAEQMETARNIMQESQSSSSHSNNRTVTLKAECVTQTCQNSNNICPIRNITLTVTITSNRYNCSVRFKSYCMIITGKNCRNACPITNITLTVVINSRRNYSAI